MTIARRLLPALLLTGAVALPAHAGPVTAADSWLLQGSVSYDCYGCSPTATFTGVGTFVRDGAVVTLPASGDLTAGESCGVTGTAYGTLHVGADDYQVWWNRAAAAVTVTAYGPGGAFRTDAGPGTLLLDAPPGTCGIPVTASLSAPLVAIDNCACVIAGGGD